MEIDVNIELFLIPIDFFNDVTLNLVDLDGLKFMIKPFDITEETIMI